MNWDAADFDWNQARAFLATAEEGSLSAAARVLNVTQPTLSRQVSALEEKLGITLFERGTRVMTLTAAGLELQHHVQAMFDAAMRVSLSASGQSQTVAGTVRIACTHNTACYHLPNVLTKIRRAAPDIQVEIATANQLTDLIQREADISIRHARPTQPELIAKLIRTTTAIPMASKAYLDRVGRPKTLQDMNKLDYLGFQSVDTLLPALNGQGLSLTTANFPVISDSGPVSLELARRGLGVGLLMPDDAAYFPDLEPVWAAFPPIEIPIWLVTHKELHTSKRIRLVFDLIAQGLS